MSGQISIEERLKHYENFTSEGWQPLLHDEKHKALAIETLAQILFIYKKVEFQYNNLFYEVFDSASSGYVINIYSSSVKDEDGCYLEKNLIDGGLCTGTCKDAIEFMM